MAEFEKYYNPTELYIDPSGEGKTVSVLKKVNRPYTVDKTAIFQGSSHIHINPISCQIDINSVMWQLNNDERRPGQKISMNMLKKGMPNYPRRVVDQRDEDSYENMWWHSGSGPHDSSEEDMYIDTTDPDNWFYDANLDDIPDNIQWFAVGDVGESSPITGGQPVNWRDANAYNWVPVGTVSDDAPIWGDGKQHNWKTDKDNNGVPDTFQWTVM